jgi:hypothetical protein
MNRWERMKYKPKFRSSYPRARCSHPEVALQTCDLDSVERTLDPKELEDGVRAYWEEVNRRPLDVQARERDFPKLTDKFLGRTPPHFIREELELIIRWKYSFDCRICDRALAGLRCVSDHRLVALTSHIGKDDLKYLLPWLRGQIDGVAVAGISAILAAARPDLFPVIDDFSLKAIHSYYGPGWVRLVARDKDGRFRAAEQDYFPYVQFCRARAMELTAATGRPWTPRMVEMALWSIGKGLTSGEGYAQRGL